MYRQLPLYCFLEEEAASVPQREDPETYEKLVESNAKYLADMMKAENLQSGSDDMRENQETAVEKEKNRPEAHLSENEKLEEKTEESDRHFQEPQVTGEKKSSETEAIPTSKPEVSPVSGPLPVRQSVQQPLHSLHWRRVSLHRLLIWLRRSWQIMIIC